MAQLSQALTYRNSLNQCRHRAGRWVTLTGTTSPHRVSYHSPFCPLNIRITHKPLPCLEVEVLKKRGVGLEQTLLFLKARKKANSSVKIKNHTTMHHSIKKLQFASELQTTVLKTTFPETPAKHTWEGLAMACKALMKIFVESCLTNKDNFWNTALIFYLTCT